jgi:hypothetical protein
MTKFLISFLLTVSLISCQQKTQNNDKDKERIDNVCDSFMKSFAEGKISKSLQLLKQNSVLSSASIDSLQVTIANQVSNLFPAYGKMLSFEFIAERKIKDFIAKRFYILKFEQYYLKFDFTLYNNGNGWTITSFNCNDELIELLN